jgi:hypothetical protein
LLVCLKNVNLCVYLLYFVYHGQNLAFQQTIKNVKKKHQINMKY